MSSVRHFATSTLLVYALGVSLNANAKTFSLCDHILTGGQTLTLDQILAQSNVKRLRVDLPVAQLELIHLEGIYPPYLYSRSLLAHVVARLQGHEKVLVMGTGTGFEAVTLARLFPGLKVDAVDINPRAVVNTELNAEFHRVDDRVRAWTSDLFEAVSGRYDFILFVAPRPLEEELARDPARQDVGFFDVAGDLLKRTLRDFPSRLNPNGRLILMTEAETIFASPLKASRVVRAPWKPTDPAEGDYGIFEVFARE